VHFFICHKDPEFFALVVFQIDGEYFLTLPIGDKSARGPGDDGASGYVPELRFIYHGGDEARTGDIRDLQGGCSEVPEACFVYELLDPFGYRQFEMAVESDAGELG